MPLEFKINQKLIRSHYAAYSLGAHSDTTNTYRVGTNDYKAFNLGREWKLRSKTSSPLLLDRRQKG